MLRESDKACERERNLMRLSQECRKNILSFYFFTSYSLSKSLLSITSEFSSFAANFVMFHSNFIRHLEMKKML